MCLVEAFKEATYYCKFKRLSEGRHRKKSKPRGGRVLTIDKIHKDILIHVIYSDRWRQIYCRLNAEGPIDDDVFSFKR